ncbi:hypothetical protein GBAR_LOCUS15184 [Geodia barretti]|uniref:Uncharacterized protein n=1 Tax=Geodia barretti TaxID=519541 RepID=A0AA35SC73_GEOBA|nr:hypothetical protein GBAR_LOCUS15184 [Geodia barretti]
MRQTLLLSHSRQSLSIVAPRSIGHHHSRIVGRYNLPDLLVTVTRAHLVHRGVIGLERHQERRLSAHSPARVVGVHHRALTHRLPKPTVPISHSAPGTAQCVLGDRALAQLHTGQRPQHRRYPTNRYAHSVVQHVRRSHHSSTHTVCACTRTGPVQHRDAVLVHVCHSHDTGTSAPGSSSPRVWASRECRSRTQHPLPPARALLHIRDSCRRPPTHPLAAPTAHLTEGGLR